MVVLFVLFLGGSFLCCLRLMYFIIFLVTAHSAYDMFSWYKYLIFNLVFSHLSFWSGNLFLIAPFPDRCLLVPFYGTISL